MGGLPKIQKTVAGNNRYYFHNSHLGAPQRLTDEYKQTVWQAQYNAFGTTHINNEQVTNNIRFPGQYFDAETGLYYNWHRYYDPETGRYLQSDPIGLAGGINTYGYVGGNPITRYDLNGLVWITRDYDHHALKNLTIGLLDRISSLQEGTVMNAHNFEHSTRDVVQQWYGTKEDKRIEDQYNENGQCSTNYGVQDGDYRKIEQTFGNYEDDWSVSGKSWHWAPAVPNKTYKHFPSN